MRRILSLILKELQALLRDRQGRMLLIGPVILQVAIFPLAATLEVKNNTLAILNEDSGRQSVELTHRLSKAQSFSQILYLRSEAELKRTIENQDALVALRFPPDFSRNIVAGRAAPLQAILDGRRSNSAQIALGYVRKILADFSAEIAGATLSDATEPQLIVRHWFNPNLIYTRHIIPSLVAIITTISTLVVTSLSVAREREQGTLDQLLVSPLTPGMIMVGKAVPAFIVATVQGTIVITAGIVIYGIQFTGSPFLLYGGMMLFILSLVGLGIFLSSLCSTQQQAFLAVFSFVMPAILLSGFPSPVENMPQWLQFIDWFNPLRHFIVIVKGTFIKDVALSGLWHNLYPLPIIAVLTLAAANWIIRRRWAG
jgi:ABC-2 type transport system permease protein